MWSASATRACSTAGASRASVAAAFVSFSLSGWSESASTASPPAMTSGPFASRKIQAVMDARGFAGMREVTQLPSARPAPFSSAF